MAKDETKKPGEAGDKMTGNTDDEAAAAASSQAQTADQQLAEISAELHQEVLKERDEYLESLQRLQAEFANFRKRVLKESEQLSHRTAADVIGDLLPVLDNFERAVQTTLEHDEQVLREGIGLVYNQLRDILTKRGLCEIEAHGQPFDPSRHEAILCRPSAEHDEGTVVEVLEKGYQLQDQIVRPAKVIVSERDKQGS